MELLLNRKIKSCVTAELLSWAELVGAWVLYRLPLEGWVAGRVQRVCRRGGFSHVVGYASSSPLGDVVVDTLLDAPLHGSACRWHLLVLAGRPAGPTRRLVGV